MRKIAISFGMLLLVYSFAQAAVTVNTTPASLITSPTTVGAASSPVGLISFVLSADATETLSSVTVTVNAVAGSTVTGSDLAKVSVYKDDGNGTFNSGTDTEIGSQTTVNVGTPTTITTASNNALTSATTFFVSLSTAASWSGTAPADSVTVTIASDGIATSANSPTVTAVTTNTISAPTTIPTLSTAVASNTAGTKSVALTFGSPTNSPTINAANINGVLVLNNSHSWLDGNGGLGTATWNAGGTVLTVTLTSAISNPTIVVGDTVTITGTIVKDLTATNNATGTATISGNFSGSTSNGGDDDDDDKVGRTCGSGLINGRLYKLAGDTDSTVYLAASCKLKPFRGAAVFRARGHKFQNIIPLQILPTADVTTDPALPAAGTLIKGSDSTVWFVTKGHKRKGFTSAAVFMGLGFNFRQVTQISDSDLATMTVDNDVINTATKHPDGALVKCTTSPTVAQVTGLSLEQFANVDSFTLRGHTFQQVATINCAIYNYVPAATIQ